MNDTAFQALSDPTRRRILKIIGDGELSAGDIASQFDISGPSMSRHFAVLKQADLIVTRREGSHIYYSLNTTAAQDLLRVLMDLLTVEPKKIPQRDA